jgi:hypothetical protein
MDVKIDESGRYEILSIVNNMALSIPRPFPLTIHICYPSPLNLHNPPSKDFTRKDDLTSQDRLHTFFSQELCVF